jgi:hypothetical protein
MVDAAIGSRGAEALAGELGSVRHCWMIFSQRGQSATSSQGLSGQVETARIAPSAFPAQYLMKKTVSAELAQMLLLYRCVFK